MLGKRDTKSCDKYVTLDIFLKCDSLDKMKTTFSEPEDNFGKIRKGVDHLYGSQGQIKGREIQKVKVCH